MGLKWVKITENAGRFPKSAKRRNSVSPKGNGAVNQREKRDQMPRIRAAFRMQTWVFASEIRPAMTSSTRSFRGTV